jgi:hypothetical protein
MADIVKPEINRVIAKNKNLKISDSLKQERSKYKFALLNQDK